MLTAVDLFSGAGGLSVGLSQEGFNPVAAVEFDPVSAKSYILNHPQSQVVVDDIRKVSGPQLLKLANIAQGELDLLTGCPPCQGFSTLRSNRRNISKRDKRNELIVEIVRLTRSIRPRAVIVENVPGLALDSRFDDFQEGLRKSGYQYQYEVLDASNFGVPQRRKRLVLVAFRDRAMPLDWFSYRSDKSTVRDAISHLAPAGASGDTLHDMPERRTPAMMRRIKATPKDGGSRQDIPVEMQCACHRKRSGYFDVYGRMAWDKVSPTITGGCNNPSRGRFLHPEEDRAITLREAALLQTFPADYQFCTERGKEHIALQIGNAFPPKLIRPIAKAVKKALIA